MEEKNDGKRLHSMLGYRSPIEFDQQLQLLGLAAQAMKMGHNEFVANGQQCLNCL